MCKGELTASIYLADHCERDEPSSLDLRLLDRLRAKGSETKDDRPHLFRWRTYVTAISECIAAGDTAAPASLDSVVRTLSETKIDDSQAAATSQCGYVYDERMRGHFDTDEPHPECPDRITF